MTKERLYKERGAKITEVLINLFAILGIVMAIDGQYDIGIIGKVECWWMWLFLVAFATIRLWLNTILKREAAHRNMLLTELMDEILSKTKNTN